MENLGRAGLAWLLILALAMLNGMFREAVLLPHLGRPAAFVLSGVLLSSCILVVAVALGRWLNLGTVSRCITVGSLWLGLTLIFEFGFGRLVQGRTWSELLEAYRFREGNIWPAVLLITFAAPFAARLPDFADSRGWRWSSS
jgi:hypothetical protein